MKITITLDVDEEDQFLLLNKSLGTCLSNSLWIANRAAFNKDENMVEKCDNTIDDILSIQLLASMLWNEARNEVYKNL